MKIALITPIYNEEESLPLFLTTLKKQIINNKHHSYSIVAINDGSNDSTAQILKEYQQQMGDFYILNLEKNLGQQAAIHKGLEYVQRLNYDAVIIIDADMQDPIDCIPKMIKLWEAGYRIVLTTYQNNPETSYLRRLLRRIYYFGLKIFTPILQNSTDFMLLDIKVLNEIMQTNNYPVLLRHEVHRFESLHILKIERNQRIFGRSKYTYLKMIKFGLLSIRRFLNL